MALNIENIENIENIDSQYKVDYMNMNIIIYHSPLDWRLYIHKIERKYILIKMDESI